MFIIALLVSTLLNVLVVIIIGWARSLRGLLKDTPREEALATTTIRLERRTIPKPESPATQPKTATQPHEHISPPQQQPLQTPLPQTPAPRRVLAQEAPTAPPQTDRTPTPQTKTAQQPTLQQQLDKQQQQYEKTVAQIHAENHALSVATIPPATPEAKVVSSFDESGQRDYFRGGHGILDPVKSWRVDAAHTCYYAEYSFRYNSGATEEGVVPWPICYPNNDDEFKKPPHSMELPTPQPGFSSNQFMTPLIKYYYNHKTGPPP